MRCARTRFSLCSARQTFSGDEFNYRARRARIMFSDRVMGRSSEEKKTEFDDLTKWKDESPETDCLEWFQLVFGVCHSQRSNWISSTSQSQPITLRYRLPNLWPNENIKRGEWWSFLYFWNNRIPPSVDMQIFSIFGENIFFRECACLVFFYCSFSLIHHFFSSSRRRTLSRISSNRISNSISFKAFNQPTTEKWREKMTLN